MIGLNSRLKKFSGYILKEYVLFNSLKPPDNKMINIQLFDGFIWKIRKIQTNRGIENEMEKARKDILMHDKSKPFRAR